MRRFAGSLAVLIVAGSAAQAQDAALDAQDVRGFLEPLGERAEEAIEAGDWRGIQAWLAAQRRPWPLAALRQGLRARPPTPPEGAQPDISG